MAQFELTIAVAAHSETVVSGPTMRSAHQAIERAEAAGIRVERLIGLDSATLHCREYYAQPLFQQWKQVELDVRDLGLARNEIAKVAQGKFIAWLDADDLFSENWLESGVNKLRKAEQNGRKEIVHPELNWLFDGASSVFAKIAQDDQIFTQFYFYFGNHYDSLCIAPKQVFFEVPYIARNRADGFGYEDWHWNLETIAAGWIHVIAKDTIIFKRRQDMSLVVELDRFNAIVAPIDIMAIDRVR